MIDSPIGIVVDSVLIAISFPRSPFTFRGYFKNQQATDDTLVDGWVVTGDVGRWSDVSLLREWPGNEGTCWYDLSRNTEQFLDDLSSVALC